MNVKGLSQKEFAALSADIRRAFADKEGGMMAIAAAVAPAIYDAIVEKEIASSAGWRRRWGCCAPTCWRK